MKKITVFLTAALLAAGAQAVAADLQDWQSNAPKNVNALKAPVRVVNLWATWCGPCRKEMPEMSAWYQKQKKGSVDMVGIALDSSENIGRFLKTTPVRYPILALQRQRQPRVDEKLRQQHRRLALYRGGSAQVRLPPNFAR
jgi:thiol-disulfide isomerase/thioredoxin